MIRKEAKRIALKEIINKITYMEISEYTRDRLNDVELEKVKNEMIVIQKMLWKKMERLESGNK